MELKDNVVKIDDSKLYEVDWDNLSDKDIRTLLKNIITTRYLDGKLYGVDLKRLGIPERAIVNAKAI
jgi:hypothetical protein